MSPWLRRHRVSTRTGDGRADGERQAPPTVPQLRKLDRLPQDLELPLQSCLTESVFGVAGGEGCVAPGAPSPSTTLAAAFAITRQRGGQTASASCMAVHEAAVATVTTALADCMAYLHAVPTTVMVNHLLEVWVGGY